MASIKTASRLVKEIAILNYISDEKNNLYITPLLNGPHGIGKSQVCREVADKMNADFYVMDGSCIKEGEATGLPFAQKNDDGSSEVRFIKYYVFNKIWQAQKFYYEKACTTGFLNGTIKLEFDNEGNEYLVVNGEKKLVRTARDILLAGDDNKYMFGEQLDGATKLKLLESGEMQPAIILIDELNRTELQTMKELMNIILNKIVNGYRIPWFVSIVSAVNPCSQNSSYATNEMDDAQLDRFLKIKVDAKLDEWIDYMLIDKNISSEVVEALAMDEGIFIHRESNQQDTSEMSPSPRSWEMVVNIYDKLGAVLSTKYFDDEERKNYNDDLRSLIKGKVGELACREVIKLINDKNNHIKPEEIFTLKEPKIDPKIVAKFKGFKALSQMIVANNVVVYINQNWKMLESAKKSSDPKDKSKYMCFKSQLSEFTNLLDMASQVVFVKKITLLPDGNRIFSVVAPAFSTDVLATIKAAKSDLKDIFDD